MELYCPSTCTFFLLNGEHGTALQEMWKVSRLSMDDYSYNEYFLTEGDQIIHANNPLIYTTLWELAYHFHIFNEIMEAKGD